jgi:hypothetical protein
MTNPTQPRAGCRGIDLESGERGKSRTQPASILPPRGI